MPISVQQVREEAAADHPLGIVVNHCAFSVPDIDVSAAWYRDILGFGLEMRSEMRSDDDELMTRVAFMKRGDFRIELFQLPGAAPLPAERRGVEEDLKTHGTKHFAFTVNSIAETLDFLREKGVDIALQPADVPDMVIPSCFIRDPDGNLIELIEPFPQWWAGPG